MQSRYFWRNIADWVFSAFTRIMMQAIKGIKKIYIPWKNPNQDSII